MDNVIWWIRKDIRLSDNQVLKRCLEKSNLVTPVFIMDPKLIKQDAKPRKNFLFEGLKKLDQDLRSRGNKLILRYGDPEKELQTVIEETNSKLILAEEGFSPYAQKRDQKIKSKLPVEFIKGSVVFHPLQISKSDGSPYKRYSAYKNVWLEQKLPDNYSWQPLERFENNININITDLPNTYHDPNFFPGEEEALKKLNQFITKNIFVYESKRNVLFAKGTSMLSPYLRFGMLSIRKVLDQINLAMEQACNEEAINGCRTWLQQLIWREFYISVLFNFPENLKLSHNPHFRSLAWRDNEKLFEAWKLGNTGYPIIDACMRQLLETGWMHNRGRMIAASFLTKDLLMNWKLGEKWFMENLIDGDPAANNGGWQWVAGVGVDAAPYYRIMNPIVQGEKFDPKGEYIRKWVPEMKLVPLDYIHQPWLMPLDIQKDAKCIIGKTYPYPVVERKSARQRALNVYKLAKESYYKKNYI